MFRHVLRQRRKRFRAVADNLARAQLATQPLRETPAFERALNKALFGSEELGLAEMREQARAKLLGAQGVENDQDAVRKIWEKPQ